MDDCLQAYDWIQLSERVGELLGIARDRLATNGHHEREQTWLAEAEALASKDARARAALLEKARSLPELGEVRREHATGLIGPWSDALEQLHAGIVFCAGPRAPIVERLFPHCKFDALRRGKLEAARAFGKEFARRVALAEVEQELAAPELAPTQPVLAQVTARFAELAGDQEQSEPSKKELDALKAQLTRTAKAVQTALKQARLLAEAALVVAPKLQKEIAIPAKPRKRSAPKPAKKKTKVAGKADAAAAEAPPKKAPSKKKTPAKKTTAKKTTGKKTRALGRTTKSKKKKTTGKPRGKPKANAKAAAPPN